MRVSLVFDPQHRSCLLGTLRVLFALSPFVPAVVKLCSLENSPLRLGHLAEGRAQLQIRPEKRGLAPCTYMCLAPSCWETSYALGVQMEEEETCWLGFSGPRSWLRLLPSGGGALLLGFSNSCRCWPANSGKCCAVVWGAQR